MDVDVVHEYLVDEDLKTVDCREELEVVRLWVAVIIGSWFLVGFSKGLK
jgi:hypothetical protein